MVCCRKCLDREGGGRVTINTLEAMAHPAAYAIFEAPPVGRFRLTDDAFVVAVRTALALPILAPTSTLCRASRWDRTDRECTMASRAACEAEWCGDTRAADRHAATCKRGGGVHSVHDNVRSAVAAVARGWGVHVLEESSEGLVDTNMRMDLLMRAAGECRGFLVTRRFDATREALGQGGQDSEVPGEVCGQGHSVGLCIRSIRAPGA